MIDSRGHERFHHDVAVYLLGALDTAEQAAFERHLSSCHICQEELHRLALAVDALPRSVHQFDPPPSLKQSLMGQVHTEAGTAGRTRHPLASWAALRRLAFARKPRVAAAAVACALLGLAAGTIAERTGPPAPTRSIEARVDSTRLGTAHATVLLSPNGGGAVRVSSMPQAAAGQVYEIWLKRPERVDAGPLFAVNQNGNGAGALPQDLHGVTQIFVTRERRGGARQPTEVPVVSARL